MTRVLTGPAPRLAPARTGAMSGVGTGLLWPRAVLSIPRPPRRPPSRSSRRGTHRLRGIFKPPRPPSTLPLVFLLPLSVTLPSRKTSAVRDKLTPAATPIFFLSFSLFYFSPLEVDLSKLGPLRQRRLELEKKEEGGDFAG